MKRCSKCRMAILMPIATFNYLKKNLWGRGLMFGAGVALILLLLGCTGHLSGAEETVPELSIECSQEEMQDESNALSTDSVWEAEVVKETKTITLSFAGDCTLGMDQSFFYDTTFNAYFAQEGADYFLKNVQEIFDEDDLTVVNMEGTLTESSARQDKQWAFKGEYEFVDVLTSGGVEAANLANNHSIDYGYQGYEDTINVLNEAGITCFGFEDVSLVDVDGVMVGLTGIYAVFEDESHLTEVQNNIKKLQDMGAQVIIANFHWGLENNYYAGEDQVELAHAAIDAGAHLVVGHHPHVLQGVEEYKGRYILYSLGNFCFGGNNNPGDKDCIIIQEQFSVTTGEEPVGILKIIPCSVSSVSWKNDYCPTPTVGAESDRILQKLELYSSVLGQDNAITAYRSGAENGNSD